MTEPTYRSRVTIDMLGGPQRLAHLPARSEPIEFGVHAEIAEHYGVTAQDFAPQPPTLDYVVAAAGGWLAGTFAGALEAHRIEVESDALEVEAEGEVFERDGVLVIERIVVRYRLTDVSTDQHEEVARVHGFHPRACPVARSLEAASR